MKALMMTFLTVLMMSPATSFAFAGDSCAYLLNRNCNGVQDCKAKRQAYTQCVANKARRKSKPKTGQTKTKCKDIYNGKRASRVYYQ